MYRRCPSSYVAKAGITLDNLKIVFIGGTQTIMVLRKELLREFISANNLKSAKDIQSALKEVFPEHFKR